MKNAFQRWLDGDIDLMEGISDTVGEHDHARAEIKERDKKVAREIDSRRETALLIAREREGMKVVYDVIAVVCCVLVILVFMYIIAQLPLYGEENVRATTVAQRYIEQGLEETGAINVVSGMILDYRAFDTLGESHVLFTALICVTILLRIDSKNQRQGFEDYYSTMHEVYFASENDRILRTIGVFLVPCIFIYGIYVLLNGQNSPGGGFSGGAIMGAAMIIFTSAFGFDRVDRFFTLKLQTYALDVAVGLVVACTMFGFYSLFRRGQMGGTPGRLIS